MNTTRRARRTDFGRHWPRYGVRWAWEAPGVLRAVVSTGKQGDAVRDRGDSR